MNNRLKRVVFKVLNMPLLHVWLPRFIDFQVRVLRKFLFITSKFQARLIHHYRFNPSTDQWDQALMRYYSQIPSIPSRLHTRPLITVLVPVFKVKASYLSECLASVAAQVYENWELSIVDDGSNDPQINDVLQRFASRHPSKVKIRIEKQNSGICGASQLALDQATGNYIALLDHDDRLLPNSLLEVARAIQANNEPDILYSDESRINEDGIVESTFHKPAWSPLFNLAAHYSTHLTVYKAELMRRAGGFRLGYEGSQDHDLMLRAVELTTKPVVHIPMILYQWRAHPQSTARSREAKPYAAVAGERAVAEACERRGWPARVEFDAKLERYRVRFELRNPNAMVSILIPNKDAFGVIEPCLKSIFTKSTYQNFEVIVIDHDSKSKDVMKLYDRMEGQHQHRFRRIPYQGSFNFGAMNNIGTHFAKGEFLVFLNNDTEVVSPQWLEELLAVAQLPSSGAVGAKLLFESGKIQHAGIVGLGAGVAGNVGTNLPANTNHYYSYFQTTHEVLAVTGACLMLEKRKFLAVGKFNEVDVPSGFGDVDLCLRLRDKNFSNVYVPHAVLIHKESTTRKAGFEVYEKWYMLSRWGENLLADPYLNPNLQRSTQYQLDFDSIFQQPLETSFRKILQPYY
ncbi:glycosyltransferase family 2 protein [Oligoflexus tunisiensis]|uniref:glycosyltransferase family 2 protein n=1 Tax=Oligoflexus tunisiensis TaxID=708132 RepID=UPI00114CBF21|nr:glycosyltransferase family 2 protein [Oligoflexus tunisiensis]